MQIQHIQKRLPLIIALACGILAILLLNIYLKRREGEIWERIKQIQQEAAQPAQPSSVMGVVLIAGKGIPPQTPITPADLLIREMPVEYIQPGVVTSLEQVIGQISSLPIIKGEQILKTKLLPPGKIGKTLAEITPTGKRAVTVSVDNTSGVVNLIQPGDYVDVFALISPPTGIAQPSMKDSAPRLFLLFQGVEALAVGGEFVTTSQSQDTQAQRERLQSSTGAPGTVTLAVSPQEAILLSFVQEHGKIKLSLRSSEDTQKEAIKPADWDTLFQYLYPAKDGGAAGRRPMVEVYRGLNKEIVPLTEKEK